MANKSLEFKRELEVFRTEGDAAVQFFYIWQTVNIVASKDRSVYRALNQAPLFWNTSLGALQSATLVTLGRVFDPDPNNHSITRLLGIAHRNLDIFSKDALAERKRELSTNADQWLPEYLKSVYVPDGEDFRRLKRHVAIRRRIYEESYRPLRHQVFAHRSASDSFDVSALFAKTNIRELQLLLVFLRRMHEALWQLFFNGLKPTLRPARYSVNQIREQPSSSIRQSQLQERLTHEAESVVRSLGKNAPPNT
ncbi:MAG: hypothetical protein K2W84_06265 [Burkholderiales bacterium]|nr:hypothetical protein [Burkholderiales bacterium]